MALNLLQLDFILFGTFLELPSRAAKLSTVAASYLPALAFALVYILSIGRSASLVLF
jgi:hypothetical protein